MIKEIRIERQPIGPGRPVFIIAEAGVNHSGDPAMALELVRRAREAGADCVKFQTFTAERVVSSAAPKAAYQILTTPRSETQLQMLKKLELPMAAYPGLVAECRRLGMVFMSTPYSPEDADFLSSIPVPAFKVASGQIVELSFLEHLARKSLPMLLSTGMATMEEVRAAVKAVGAAGSTGLVLLQCTTDYPSSAADANLRAIRTMSSEFGIPVGYSDHTSSDTACIAAVALGACVVEKHFTLDKTLPGPDHSCSADPEEFKSLAARIRETESMLGTGEKIPTAAESRNIPGMRRSIVAKRPIRAGTVISPDMLAFRRPASGISPDREKDVAGSVAKVDIAADEFISWEQLEK